MASVLRAVWNKLAFLKGSENDAASSKKNNTLIDLNSNEVSAKETIKNKTGTITHFEPTTLTIVIDRKYTWKLSDTTPLYGFRKNDKIIYSAYYDDESGDWVVVNATPKLGILATSGDGLELKNYQTGMYKVIIVKKDSVVVSQNNSGLDMVEVPLRQLPQDYPVESGDWLELTLEAVEVDSLDITATVLGANWCEMRTERGRLEKRANTWTVGGRVFIGDQHIGAFKEGDHVHVISVASERACVGVRGNRFVYKKRAVEVKAFELLGIHGVREEGLIKEAIEDNEFQMKLLDAMDDRNGIVVEPHETINVLAYAAESATVRDFTISNKGNDVVTLESVRVVGIQDVAKIKLLLPNNEDYVPEELQLQPRESLSLKVACSSTQVGRSRELIKVSCKGFSIIRIIAVTCLRDNDRKLAVCQSQLQGMSTEKRRRSRPPNHSTFQKRLRRVSCTAIRQAFYMPNRLENYRVPSRLRDLCASRDEEKFKAKMPELSEPLNPVNYVTRFQHALWFEEMEQEKLRDQFNILDAKLGPTADDCIYVIKSQNLLEIKPPLMSGDSVLIRSAENAKTDFQGFVIRYASEALMPEVHVKFSSKMDISGAPVNIKFILSRTNFKRQHFGVTQAAKFLGESWLFPLVAEAKPAKIMVVEDPENSTQHAPIEASPIEEFDQKKTGRGRAVDFRQKSMWEIESKIVVPDPLKECKMKWYNRELNDEQKKAVQRIIRGQGRPLPYVIFGPPGTGKTVTLVEAILQLYFLDPNSRILVTVPSNTGADNIAERLIDTNRFRPGDLVRLNGFTRNENGIRSEKMAYYTMDGENLESVARHRLIISTVATAGQFFSLNLYTGHFSHVFVDEAGYCTEPEAMIACVLSAIDQEGQVILAGDPQQLGPVLMCDYGVCKVLYKSFLERIMETGVYKRNEAEFPDTKYNPLVLTKLVRNYRSNPFILHVPSNLFYDGELRACAADVFELAKKLTFLPKKNVPLVLEGVQGKCEQDETSPSWYNLAEVTQVIKYVKQLKEAGVEDADIGIITPYRKQVEKIRLGLTIYWKGNQIKVASVQEFQGGEKQVIIISTVRSESSMVESGSPYQNLDFVFAQKLFNVSVTRARSAMIVIGNPHILNKSTFWSAFLEYCVDLGVYRGCDLPVKFKAAMIFD